MKKIIKRISLLLALLMLLSLVTLFTSCKKDEEAEGTTATTVVTDTEEPEINYKDFLPEGNFEGEEITIYTTYEQIDSFRVAEDKVETSIFDQAIYARNVAIEDMYNVVLEFAYEDTHDVAKYTMVCTQAGAYEYDIMAAAYWWGLEQQGGYVNLLDYDVLKFENPYWIDYWNKASTINGKCFTALGYCAMTPISKSCVVYYNSETVEDMQFDDPIEMVESGDWTLASMKELMLQNTFDNGDGITNFDDTYGLGYNLWSGRAFLWGAGMTLSQFDDGEIEFKLRTAKNTDVFDAVYSFLKDGGAAYYRNNIGVNWYTTYDSDRMMFMQGRALFFSHNLESAAEIATSGKIDNYGVLPMPKLDESQTDYITPITGGINLAIFKEASNVEHAAAILEAMCILTYEDILPVYYEDMLKLRYQTDAESAEMLDFIRSKVKVDFAFINSARFDYVADAPFDLIAADDTNFEGAMQSWTTKVNTKLEGFLELYNDAEEQSAE